MPSHQPVFIAVSHYYPPVLGGTSTVVANLLSAFHRSSYAVITQQLPPKQTASGVADLGLAKPQRVGLPPFPAKLPFRYPLARWLRYASVPMVRNAIVRVSRETRASFILSVFPSWPYYVAAYSAHLKTGIPLVTYHMDATVVDQRAPWQDRRFGVSHEEASLRAAATRLVLSESLAESFRQRYGLTSTVIPHSVDIGRRHEMAKQWAGTKILGTCTGVTLLHTGVVEGLQTESLLRIVATLDQHPELQARLVLITPSNAASLRDSGFDRPFVTIITSLTNSQVAAAQKEADILLAVLPFRTGPAELRTTAFPTKVIEYMVAGKPILVHAPPDSFFAGEIRRSEYAVLVDTPSTTQLAQAIQTLRDNQACVAAYVQKAQRIAHDVYALPVVAARFADACGLPTSILR